MAERKLVSRVGFDCLVSEAKSAIVHLRSGPHAEVYRQNMAKRLEWAVRDATVKLKRPKKGKKNG